MKTVYYVGHNMAGYLPECDVLCAETAEEAKSVLLSDINYAAEQEDMYCGDQRVAELLEAGTELETADVSAGWLVYVTLNSGAQAFWINAETVADDFDVDQYNEQAL